MTDYNRKNQNITMQNVKRKYDILKKSKCFTEFS